MTIDCEHSRPYPIGRKLLHHLDVEVRDDVCRSSGVLAGSVLTQDRAVANLQTMTGASLTTGVRLASYNPAQMMSLGRLTEPVPGSPANFNIYSAAGHRVGSLLNGLRLPA